MSLHAAKFLVCYDICDNRRLRRVHKAIRDWGLPIQYSIFEVAVNAQQLAQLIEELTALIDIEEDKVMFYRLSLNQERISLGMAVQTEDLLFV